MQKHFFLAVAGCGILSVALLAGCSGGSPASDAEPNAAGAEPLVLITHDSFSLSEGTLEAFTEQTGIGVTVHSVGDSGAMVNQLVLTADSPLGDVVYGIDSTFASRAVNGGVLADYVSPDAAAGPGELLLPSEEGGKQLTPIDFGDVCVNADVSWFAEKGLEVPSSLNDLTDPTYAHLFVTPAASTSSPGLAFLLATIAAYGDDGWQQYWRELMANGAKITAGWTDAYTVDFSGSSGEGDRPLVLSYASSPAAEVTEGSTEASTVALLDTCFRQVEYAGVIAGTEHMQQAQHLVDFLYSVVVQDDIPGNMFVYPANPEAELPELWSRFAKVAEQPYTISPADIGANREAWITEWAEITIP